MADARAAVPCAVFDFDGTLIDSVPDIAASLNATLSGHGIPPLSEPDVSRRVGAGAARLIKGVLDEHGRPSDDALVESLKTAFLNRYAENPTARTRVFPGAHEVLARCRDDGYAVVLCTNKPSITTVPVIRALNLSDSFDAVCCFDHVRFPKPDGRHIIDAVALVNGDASRTVMVGDSANDINAAIDAGVPSIAVRHGYTAVPADELGATCVVDRLDQVPALLSRLLR